MMETMNLIFGQGGWKIYKEKKKNDFFKGPVDIRHMINDCIKDRKIGFLAICDKNAIVGVSAQLEQAELPGFFFSDRAVYAQGLAFHTCKIERKTIPAAIEFLKTANKKIRAGIRKRARRITEYKKAGKFSNAPVTKVLVF